MNRKSCRSSLRTAIHYRSKTSWDFVPYDPKAKVYDRKLRSSSFCNSNNSHEYRIPPGNCDYKLVYAICIQ